MSGIAIALNFAVIKDLLIALLGEDLGENITNYLNTARNALQGNPVKTIPVIKFRVDALKGLWGY